MASRVAPHVNPEIYGGKFHYGHAMQSMFDGVKLKGTFDSSTTTGTLNDVFGAALYNQVNLEAPMFGVLPKIDETGRVSSVSDDHAITFRAPYDDGTNLPSVGDVGEGASLPSPEHFKTAEVVATPKRSVLKMDESIFHSIKTRLQDGVGFDEAILPMGEAFLERSVEADGLANNIDTLGETYSQDNNICPIDRVVSSNAEQSNVASVDADDVDVYDIDRSDTTEGNNDNNWADAEVNHNSGTDRKLTRDLMNTQIDNQIKNSTARKENLVIITGYDSARVLSDLRDAQFRADALSQAGREEVNDAETRLGLNFQAQISHWDGIPVVVSPNTPSDSISRIYILDPSPAMFPSFRSENARELKPKIGIEEYLDPYTERSGLNQTQGLLATDDLTNKALFLLYHEVVCRDFGAQGKIRNVQE